MARNRLDSAEKKRRRRQRDKENQEKKRAAKAKRGRPSLAEEERKEQRRRTYLCYNEKRRSSQESFAPSFQDSSQHPATNASISRQQNHQRLIVETVGADESDDEDELPDTNAILQASQQSIHAERMEAVVGGPSERMDIDAAIIYKSAKTHVKEKRACKSFSLVGFLQEQPVERRENANSCCHHQVT